MPKFIKDILKPADYLVTTPGGGRRKESFTRERLESMANTFNAMLAEGVQIPAPWGHDYSLGPVTADKNPVDAPARNNAGWWKQLWVTADGTLKGQLEVPLAADAERIGTTIREVSPWVKPTFTGGSGREHKDAIAHIALVTHPVVPGQDNFIPLPEADLAASFSLSMADLALADEGADPPQSKPSAADVVAALKLVGLTLPDDTDDNNLLDRIVTAAKAVGEGNQEDDLVADKADPDSKEQNKDITMSLAYAQKLTVQNYNQRIAALVESQRLTKAYADATLAPMLAGFSLSLDDKGEPIPGPLDIVLGALEALPQPADAALSLTDEGGHDNPLAGSDKANEDLIALQLRRLQA